MFVYFSLFCVEEVIDYSAFDTWTWYTKVISKIITRFLFWALVCPHISRLRRDQWNLPLFGILHIGCCICTLLEVSLGIIDRGLSLC